MWCSHPDHFGSNNLFLSPDRMKRDNKIVNLNPITRHIWTTTACGLIWRLLQSSIVLLLLLKQGATRAALQLYLSSNQSSALVIRMKSAVIRSRIARGHFYVEGKSPSDDSRPCTGFSSLSTACSYRDRIATQLNLTIGLRRWHKLWSTFHFQDRGVGFALKSYS